MDYPLQFRFKLLALASQIYVQDATGRTLCYVRQKMLRLREKVEVFTDEHQQHRRATIEADRIIDWSARYVIKDEFDNVLGSVGRRGLRSLWSAHYQVTRHGSDEAVFSIREENPFVKVLDGAIGELPVIGMFSGFFLHPRYVACRADGTPVMRLTKQKAFFEGRFDLVKLADLDREDEFLLVLSFLMMNLIERNRG